MFSQSNWKNEVVQKIDQLEAEIGELQKSQKDLRSQNLRLTQSLRTVTRKLVMRLPLSLESLDKGLRYDLIFPEEIEAWLELTKTGVLIDLRSHEDFEAFKIPQAINIPADNLSQSLDKIHKNQPVLLVCENGVKSVTASESFLQKGFSFVYVLKGGMHLYRQQRTEAAQPVGTA